MCKCKSEVYVEKVSVVDVYSAHCIVYRAINLLYLVLFCLWGGSNIVLVAYECKKVSNSEPEVKETRISEKLIITLRITERQVRPIQCL